MERCSERNAGPPTFSNHCKVYLTLTPNLRWRVSLSCHRPSIHCDTLKRNLTKIDLFDGQNAKNS